MRRAGDDGYFTGSEALGVGDVHQLTEFDGWTQEEIAEHEARRARRRPVGFAPWPGQRPRRGQKRLVHERRKELS